MLDLDIHIYGNKYPEKKNLKDIFMEINNIYPAEINLVTPLPSN